MTVDNEHLISKILGDVSIPLKVQCDVVHIAVEDIAEFKIGTVITFDKVVGEPMDVLVADKMMARGEVVVVNAKYGVRLSEIIR